MPRSRYWAAAGLAILFIANCVVAEEAPEHGVWQRAELTGDWLGHRSCLEGRWQLSQAAAACAP